MEDRYPSLSEISILAYLLPSLVGFKPCEAKNFVLFTLWSSSLEQSLGATHRSPQEIFVE